MSIACANQTAPSCKIPGERESSESSGRRIYINEDSLTELASHGETEARLVYRMAARTVALKSVHQIDQDAGLFGVNVPEHVRLLQENITVAWSNNTTGTLRRIAHRPRDPRGRADLHAVLSESEEISASCYFSNYYTFATTDKTAELMFQDTNDIASMRRRMLESDEYKDLTLISGNCLILITDDMILGAGKAEHHFKQLREQTLLSSLDLKQIKADVYRETRRHLEEMIARSQSNSLLPKSEHEHTNVVGVLRALDYAFTKGILKAS